MAESRPKPCAVPHALRCAACAALCRAVGPACSLRYCVLSAITARCCRSCLHHAGVHALQPARFSPQAGWGDRGCAFPPCFSPSPCCVPQNVRRQCSECWDAMQRYIEQPAAGELLMVQVGAAAYCVATAVCCAFCKVWGTFGWHLCRCAPARPWHLIRLSEIQTPSVLALPTGNVQSRHWRGGLVWPAGLNWDGTGWTDACRQWGAHHRSGASPPAAVARASWLAPAAALGAS